MFRYVFFAEALSPPSTDILELPDF